MMKATTHKANGYLKFKRDPKNVRSIERNGTYYPAIVSPHSGRVLKVYRDLDGNLETVKAYIRGIKREMGKNKNE